MPGLKQNSRNRNLKNHSRNAEMNLLIDEKLVTAFCDHNVKPLEFRFLIRQKSIAEHIKS